ncbi:MAG TPA: nuclear transport factor 2 family protein, partial [Caulobacteraceae bacterium]|nr:nuclear transport factor 2 family protein [Caulobacteraceae bacterium]
MPGTTSGLSLAALAGAVALAICISAPTAHAAPPPGKTLDAEIDRLSAQVDQLEGARAVRKLQRAYGYYVDRGLWDEAADLFADDGTIEVGMDGVYVGKARVREYLQREGGGKPGLSYGQLNEHLQLQPEVDVAADGLSAKGRWRDMAMLGHFHEDAYWGDGIEENSYVKEGGVWKIRSLHLYVNFIAPFEGGWARMKPAPADWRTDVAKVFPPDRPPTETYRPFPEPQLPPFHYPNPVTGKGAALAVAEIKVSDPQLKPYAHRIELLKDKDAVENLQAAYGYYFDKSLWSDVADLFARGGSFEYGQRGVYVGKDHIKKALLLFGREGPEAGKLNNSMQLQSVIHVAPDGRTAKARWRGMVQLGRANQAGQWGEGTYENDYVKEDGVWKIARL